MRAGNSKLGIKGLSYKSTKQTIELDYMMDNGFDSNVADISGLKMIDAYYFQGNLGSTVVRETINTLGSFPPIVSDISSWANSFYNWATQSGKNNKSGNQ